MEQTTILQKAVIDEVGVECAYKTIITADDGTENITEYSRKETRPPHEDLTTQIEVLNLLMKEHLKTERNADVTKIVFSGKEEKAGVVLAGTLDGRIKFQTPKLPLEGESDFTVKLSLAIELLKTEIHLYLFEGKSAQLSLFGE